MVLIIYPLLICLAIILFLWQLSNIISLFFGCPFVVTKHAVIDRALELAKVGKGDVVYDIGSGTGEVLKAAAKRGATAVGFEISPFYYWLSKLLLIKYRNVTVNYGDLTKADLSKATHVFCYLMPGLINKINFPKNKGRIISIGFQIPNLKKISVERYHDTNIFFYQN